MKKDDTQNHAIAVLLVLGMVISAIGIGGYYAKVTGYADAFTESVVKVKVTSTTADTDNDASEPAATGEADPVLGTLLGFSTWEPTNPRSPLVLTQFQDNTIPAWANLTNQTTNASAPMIIHNRGSFPIDFKIDFANVQNVFSYNITQTALAFTGADLPVTILEGGWNYTMDINDTSQGTKTFQSEYYVSSVSNNLPHGVPLHRSEFAIPGVRGDSMVTWQQLDQLMAVFNVEPYLTNPIANEIYVFPFLTMETPLPTRGTNVTYNLVASTTPLTRQTVVTNVTTSPLLVGGGLSTFIPYSSYLSNQFEYLLINLSEWTTGSNGYRDVEILALPGTDFGAVSVLNATFANITNATNAVITKSDYYIYISNITVTNDGVLDAWLNISLKTTWCDDDPANNPPNTHNSNTWIPNGYAMAVFDTDATTKLIDNDVNFVGKTYGCNSNQVFFFLP